MLSGNPLFLKSEQTLKISRDGIYRKIIFLYFFFREEEGRDLLGKRTMDFKVTYLDAGLTSAYFDGDTPNSNGSSNSISGSGNSGNTGNSSTKVPKRYKAHLRDFLSSCRTKRSKSHNSSVSASDIYAAVDPAAAAAASALPYATVYSSPPSATHPTYGADSPLYMQQNIASSPYQTIYPVDNR